MSTSEESEDPGAADWRILVTHFLTTWFEKAEFGQALKAAKAYNIEYPVEDGILDGEPAPAPTTGRPNVFEKVQQGTLDKLTREHRDKLGGFFVKKNIPLEVAGHIVDDLILGKK